MLKESNMSEYTSKNKDLPEVREDPGQFVMNGNSRHHLISAVIYCENGPRETLRETELSKVQTTPTHTWQNDPHLSPF